MPRHILFSLVVLPLFIAAAAVPAAGVSGAKPGDQAARLDYFAHPDGTNYFALSLKPSIAPPPAGSHNMVVLFDTSASQAGEFRTEALKTLKDDACQSGPRRPRPTDGGRHQRHPADEAFVAPNSPDMAEAVKKLNARVPLGSTDMEKALDRRGR